MTSETISTENKLEIMDVPITDEKFLKSNPFHMSCYLMFSELLKL